MSARSRWVRSGCVAAALALSWLGVGCGEESTEEPAQAASEITYYRDVKPILDRKCVGCHSAGNIGGFSLATYAEVAPMAKLIASVTASGQMPPWPAADDCNDYANDPTLSTDELAALARFSELDAPEGDPAEEPPPVADPRADISRVDVTVGMEESFTPTEEPDQIRCFVLDWPEQSDSFITGIRVRPGNLSVVHHAVIMSVPPAEVAGVEAADDLDPGPGYDCGGGATMGLSVGGAGSALVAGWVPGNKGSDLPAGTGLKIAAGSKLVMQMHYNTAASGPGPDQTSIDFKVDATVEKEAFTLPIANPLWIIAGTMTIPANAPDVMHAFSAPVGFFTQEPLTVYAGLLHMHQRGTTGTVRVQREGQQDACVLGVDDWDFHWQMNYELEKPMTVLPSDSLYIECHWDNSQENQPLVNGEQVVSQDMKWGEGTGDEMCLAFLYATRG